ncbi:MAG TPA: nucleotidyltransferase domain-containing protein [Candidatus Peribacteraceae bacterium]|nr:nucleotidyltransferase domain-containing protein [Candidatus Peribacteraceae bacterium]
MKREDGLRIAQQFKKHLLKKGYPIQQVILYGSVAKGTAHAQSDIDIAVVTKAFLASQMQENVDIFIESKHIDLRIETVTLHPEDFQLPYFTLAREIERTGLHA